MYLRVIWRILDGMNSSACPECGHDERGASSGLAVAVRRALRLPQQPAECPVEEFDASGWGSVSCGCRHPFHGS